MILPIDKLLAYKGNKYILSRASMQAVDKKDKIENFPENLPAWKTVPVILKLMLEGKLKIKEPSEEIKE